MAVSARELIFGRSSQLKVFVSSKMAGGALKPERQAAVREIESFPSMRAWHWERDAVAGTFYSEEECVGNAATSEVLVLILEDELTEITRKEYFAAKRAGAHRVVLHRTGVGRSTPLERFIDRERKRDAVTAGYGNVSELETRLFEALRAASVRPVRERMLRLREATRQVSRAYDDLDICVGEDEGTLQPLSDAITEARQLVRGGDVDEAYNVMYGFAEQALSVGLVGVANHLVEDLRDIIPAAALDERREGWVLNVEGRALSAAGQADAARARFDRMRQLGRSLDDHDLESTALQNLGIEEIEAGNYDEAMRVHRDALMLKRDAGDVYGGLQVLMNQVNVFAGREQLEAAEALLDDLEYLVRRARLPALRASVAGQRAQLRIEAGDLDGARPLLLESLRVARRVGAPDRELTALRNLARLDRDRESHRQSLRWARKAQAAAESLGDRVQEEIVRRSVAIALYDSGQIDEAVLQFGAAAELAAELGDAYHHAESLANAAACLTEAGRPEDAVEMLDTALANSASTDDDWRARQLGNLAAAYQAAGNASKAIETLEQAANLSPDWEAQAQFLRGAAQVALSEVRLAPRAPDLLDAELEIRRHDQNGSDWAWAAAEMGATLSHTSQVAHAHRFFTAALRVFAATGDHQRSFFIRNDRAIAASESGDLPGARADLKRSLTLARELSDRALEGQALSNLSEIERRAGRPAVARTYAVENLNLTREMEDPGEEAAALVKTGLIDADAGDLDAADRALQEGLRLARGVSNTQTEAEAIKHLAHTSFLRAQFGKAADFYRRALARMDDHPGRARAEVLGGAIMAEARMGRVDGGLVQELIDVSRASGWEREATEGLFDAAQSLLRRRRPSAAGELAALSLVLELGLLVVHEDRSDRLPEPTITRLAHLVWLAVSTRQAAFARKLRQEVERHTGTDAFASVIDAAVEAASEQGAKERRAIES